MGPEGPFVLDASVTAALLFDDEDDPAVDALLRGLRTGQAVVPPIWHLEIANMLVVAERRGRLTAECVAQRLEGLARLRARTFSAAPAPA